MSISYEGIGQVMVTCLADQSTVEGQVVKMSSGDTVAPCAAGDQICGVAGPVSQDGFVAVHVKGFVTVPCTDSTVTEGYMSLTANGTGGVKAAGSGDEGITALVMNVGGGEAVICL